MGRRAAIGAVAWLVMVLACLLGVGCGGAGAPPAPPPRPNVVLVLVDALRAQSLGLYGYSRQTSPYLARFARKGFVFVNARAQAPCTFPSVNSLFTGRPPLEFAGQPDGKIGIPKGVPTLAALLRRLGYSTTAISASPVVRKTPSSVNPSGGFDRGFELFSEDCLWRPARCVDQRAAQLLPKLGIPFFLYLHYMDVHGPYRPPEIWTKRFAVGPFSGSAAAASGNPNPLNAQLLKGADPASLPRADVERLRDLYDDEIAYFDSQLEVLVQELEARGVLDQTLFVILADHGEEFLEHGHLKHCNGVWDTEIRTPLILRFPKGLESAPPRRVRVQAANVDVLPTILDYLRIEPPANVVGTSLRPAIENGREVHGAVFSSWGEQRAATDGRYKLILRLDDGTRELFDLSSDPGETRDVLAQHPREAHRLARELAHWIRDVENAGRTGKDRRGEEAIERLKSLGYLQ